MRVLTDPNPVDVALLVAAVVSWIAVSFTPPRGAFYAFINVGRHFGRTLGGVEVVDSTSFCQAALTSARVALVMGSAFGAEEYVRISFATSMGTLERGFDALGRLLEG